MQSDPFHLNQGKNNYEYINIYLIDRLGKRIKMMDVRTYLFIYTYIIVLAKFHSYMIGEQNDKNWILNQYHPLKRKRKEDVKCYWNHRIYQMAENVFVQSDLNDQREKVSLLFYLKNECRV